VLLRPECRIRKTNKEGKINEKEEKIIRIKEPNIWA
jgi:hypothetical protein